jgi:hypothetical protein
MLPRHRPDLVRLEQLGGVCMPDLQQQILVKILYGIAHSQCRLDGAIWGRERRHHRVADLARCTKVSVPRLRPTNILVLRVRCVERAIRECWKKS